MSKRVVHFLGIALNARQRVRFALTSVHGIGHHTAHRLCARFLLHDTCKVGDLTPYQVTAMASFLSNPSAAHNLPRVPVADPEFVMSTDSMATIQAEFNEIHARRKARRRLKDDPLLSLKIESELRREVRDNINHQRSIGSYVGRRHAMHLPVRGQNTQSNARTARKLNHTRE